MNRDIRPSGLELALNELWLPDTARPRPQPNESQPQRPNRAERRRMDRATKRRGKGWTR